MSRKLRKDAKPGRRPEDPKEAYTQEQLAQVGAIALIWNQIELSEFLDLHRFAAAALHALGSWGGGCAARMRKSSC
jgi:hypothetical protein